MKIIFVAVAFGVIWLDAPPQPAGKALQENNNAKVEKLFSKMTAAADKIKDYTCIFTKQEYVDGEMLPMETIFMKHRKKPKAIYMKWIKEPHLDREVLYCEGKYGNRLKAHEGHGLSSWVGTLTLDPKGGLAMRGTRHPVTEAGIFNSIKIFKRDLERARAHPEHKVRYKGFEEVKIHGQPSILVVAMHPKSKKRGYYASKAEICFHQKLFLPTSLKVWDFAGRVVEIYTYRNYKLNVKLTDKDFDYKNKEYNF